MDALSKKVDAYLRLLSRTALLVPPRDRANINLLLTMLGPADKAIIEAAYGINGQPASSLNDIAGRYSLTGQQVADIITKDLRHIAVTPEWQMMLQSFPEAVRKRL